MSASCGFGPAIERSGKPLALAMQTLWLTGQVLPMGARLWVRHEFQSSEPLPVEIVYSFMLPRDATLRRFRVTGEDFSVVSELQPVERARAIYEEGIQAGSVSTLTTSYKDGLVNLSVGNVRPGEKVLVLLELLAGVELHDDGLRLRFPFTLAPSYHAQARSIELEPGVGEIELPESEFGDIILPSFVTDESRLHRVGFDLELGMDGIHEVSSPSHSIRVGLEAGHSARVSLSRSSDLPNRDLVLDVKQHSAKAETFGGFDNEGKGHFVVRVSSTEFGDAPSGARKMVILLDRSGSMAGQPIEQARRAIAACLSTLNAEDEFALIAFDNRVEHFRLHLTNAVPEERQAASDFLRSLSARGGTELADGLKAAVRLLQTNANDTAGDVLVITDGQVFGTNQVLDAARSTGARIHCLGIGDASQDRFLAQLASQTGGVSRFVTPGEAVDLAALDLFASIVRPVARNLIVSAPDGIRIQPEPPSTLYRGSPLLFFGETGNRSSGALDLRWESSSGARQLTVPLELTTSALATTVKLLQGSRLIADAESRTGSLGQSSAAKRESERYELLVRNLSREFDLASSQMSLVAVATRPGDRSGEVPKTKLVAIGMEQDIIPPDFLMSCAMSSEEPTEPPTNVFATIFAAAPREQRWDAILSALKSSERKDEFDLNQLLFELASRLEPDGGMPGREPKHRILNSFLVLLCLLENGSSFDKGPFRAHICRLLTFIKARAADLLPPAQRDHILQVLDRAGKHWQPPAARWTGLAKCLLDEGDVDPVTLQDELERL